MKTAGRIAVWVVATVAVIAGGALLYLSSGPGENFLRGLAAEKIGEALDAAVTIERLETDLFSRMEVENVSIQPASDSSSIPAIGIDRLRVRYSLFTLIFDGLEVDSVVLSGGRVDIRPDSIPSPPDTGAPAIFGEDGSFIPPVRIGFLDVSGLTVDYRDRSIPFSATGSGIRVTAGMDERSSGTFRIEAESTRVKGLDSPLAVTGVLLAGTINSRAVGAAVVPATVDSFRAGIEGMTVAGRFDIRRDSITGSLAIAGDPTKLLAAVSEGLDGEVGGGWLNADVAFRIDDPFDAAPVSWSIGVPAYTVAGVAVKNFRCDGSLSGDTLTVARLAFGVYGGTVDGNGRMTLDSLLPHSFDLSAKGVRVSDYWKTRTKPGELTRLPVTVDATVRTGGNLSAPADISARSNLSIFIRRSLVAAPALSYSRRHLSVRSEKGMARLAAEIDLRLPADAALGYDGTVELSVPSIGALSPFFDARGLDGSLDAAAEVSGGGGDITASATATSDGISYRGLDVVDELFASARFEDDALIVDSLLATGWSVDLAELAGVTGAEADSTESGAGGITGTLSYTLTARGTIDNPSAELAAEIDAPAYGTIAFDDAALLAGFADSVVRLTEFAIRKDSSLTTLTGRFDLRGRTGDLTAGFTGPGISPPDSVDAGLALGDSGAFTLSAATRHFSVAAVRGFVPSLPFDGGQIDLTADIRYSPDSLHAVVPFALTALTAGKGKLDSIAGTARLAGGTLFVDSLTVVHAARHFFLDAEVDLLREPGGSYAFDWDGRTRGRFTCDSISLDAFVPFFDEPVDLGGSADADIRWDGVVRRPGFRGSLDLRGVRYGPEPRSPWFTGLAGTIRLGEGSVRSDSLRANVGKVPVIAAVGFERGTSTDFTASVGVWRDSVLLLNADAAFSGDSIRIDAGSRDLDLAVLQPFAEDLRKLNGTLSAELTVRGPAADPEVAGSLVVAGASFEPGSGGHAVTGGAVNARLSGGRLVLDSAAASFGGGRVAVSGSASLDSGALKELDFGLRASGIKVTKKGLYQVGVKSTDLKLASAGDRYRLTGAVEFGESKFVRDIEIGDIVEMMSEETGDPLEDKKKEEPLDLMTTVTESPAVKEDLPDFAKKIDFDIELKNADGFWVDNNLAKFRSLHELRLQGNLETASLTGRISVRDRGELIFLDRRFEILNGVIDCSDPRRLNPVINLTAQTEITEQSGSGSRPTRYTITLTVTGPLDEFEYELTSKPSLARADIISLLALGMTQYALESGGNKDDVYKERSEVVASQQISNSVNRFFDNWLGDFLALDHIGIGGNLFDPNQTRFEVTKRWSDRVEIRYSTSITNVDEQILSAEYRINDWLFLEGKTDQQEDSGADLKFRIWFK